jgi:hypothetical protein
MPALSITANWHEAEVPNLSKFVPRTGADNMRHFTDYREAMA